MFIYLTTNLINGRKYIGLCTQDSSKRYLGSGILLRKAIKKYGYKNFKREILEECINEEELKKAEQKWIRKYDAVKSEEFYNLHKGGRGGYIPKEKGMMSIPIKKYWDSLTSEEKILRCENVGKYDKRGSKNPRAKRAKVNGKIYSCLKDALKDFDIPYSSLKAVAQGHGAPKWKHLTVEYI